MSRARLPVLLAVAALAAACGGGSSSPTTPVTPATPAPAGDQSAIAIVGSSGPQSFNPNPVTLKVGQFVAWRNSDSLAHHIVVDEPGAGGGGGNGDGPGYSYGGSTSGGAFDSGTVAPGAVSGSITATSAGTLHYHCTIHPTMTGSIAVTQ